MKQFLKRTLPRPVVRAIKNYRHARKIAALSAESDIEFRGIDALVRPGDTVVDLGANMGYFTKLLSAFVGPEGTVHAVEPIPDSYDLLVYVVRKLGLANVRPHNCAVSDSADVVTMEIPLLGSGEENLFEAKITSGAAAGDTPAARTRTVTVATTTLDELVAPGTPPAFIKCDVEGHELPVLRGALTLLRRDRPAWFIEIWGDLDERGSRAWETAEFLRQFGYAPYFYDDAGFRPRREGEKEVNYFFLTPAHLSQRAISRGEHPAPSALSALPAPSEPSRSAEGATGAECADRADGAAAAAGIDFPATSILGVRVNAVTRSEAIAAIRGLIEGGGKWQIVPVNPEMVMAAQRNEAFRDVLNSAALTLPDGIGVVAASRLSAVRIRERVTGVDTVLDLAQLAAERGYRLYLLGAAPGVAERAARRLEAEFDGLVVAGTFAGSPHPEDEAEIRRRVNAVHPDILLVAYGAPGQELWAARNLAALRVRVVMCVGGTFDFLAGVVPRAPAWIRAAGFEWLFRLVRDPRRLRRMLALPRFAGAVLRNGLVSH